MNSSQFKKMIDEHRDRIYTHALYFLGCAQDADDVTQEVFIRAWQNRETIRPQTTKAWIMRVTNNLCIDYSRRYKTSRAVIQNEDFSILEGRAITSNETEVERTLENTENLQQILSALQKLPENFRSVIMLRDIQGLKYKEISQILDIPINTVKVYIHRGRSDLKKALCQLVAE